MITFVRGTTYLAALILNVFLLILVSECHKAPEPKQISYSEFLFEVGAGHVADGFDTSRGVIIIAATNTPEVLDTPLMRAGRFDRQIIVDRPDREGRETILKIYVGKIKLAWDVDSDNSRSWKTRSP